MSDKIVPEMAITLAARLRTLRLMRGWTREELAERADVNVFTLKRFERSGQIALSRLVNLCEALEVNSELESLFKPRQRVSIGDWKVSSMQIRKRGRRRTSIADEQIDETELETA